MPESGRTGRCRGGRRGMTLRSPHLLLESQGDKRVVHVGMSLRRTSTRLYAGLGASGRPIRTHAHPVGSVKKGISSRPVDYGRIFE